MASSSLPRRASISFGRSASAARSTLGLSLAGAQGLDLLARLGDAVPPKLSLRGDGLEPLLAQLHLTLEAFERGFGAGVRRAALAGAATRAVHRLFERRERGKLEPGRADPRDRVLRLGERRLRPALGFGERAELLAVGKPLMLLGGDGVAGAVKLLPRLAQSAA